MKRYNYVVCFLLMSFMSVIYSCGNKENTPAVFSSYITPNVVDAKKNTELKKITTQYQQKNATDSIDTDSISEPIDCYRWNHEYNASTKMINEEDGTPFDLNILITLQETRNSDEYEGGMVLYVDEENFVEAAVVGLAEGNHIIVYYKEDRENTTGTLFKHNDKLVMFEVTTGEILASWYTPMHDFVDESTVISIK